MANVFHKQPSETKNWIVDFSNRLRSGYTLQSLTSIAQDPSGLTITNEAVNNDTQIKFTAAGGADATTYTLTFAYVTTDGVATEALEAEVLVRVLETPVSTGIPFKPPEWRLEIGHRYMKGVLPELAPVDDEEKGITQNDLDAAEKYAWRIILTRLIAQYDVSTFGNDPPIPLFEIWDLLASSYVIELVGQRKNIEDEAAIETHEKWFGKANTLLRSILNPTNEADRTALINNDGTIHHKRSNVAIPRVAATTGAVFFPSGRDEVTAWGDSLKGSTQQFIEEHSIKVYL